MCPEDMVQRQRHKTNIGIRITPEKGKMFIFYSLLDDGRAFPRFFQGGEEIFKILSDSSGHKEEERNSNSMPLKSLLSSLRKFL